jgi:SAM-dependent methyltransferase
VNDRWADYWARPGAREGGCLPDGGDEVRPALELVWQEFARGLPPKARLLDLATGDGAVLKMVRAVRGDLSLTGVDSAPTLPAAPPGIQLRAGVAMEKLPFADASFEAVTSQFGLEYGEVAAIAEEAARVLKPAGRLRAAVHHKGGAIAHHNAERRKALLWAVEESGVLERARRLAAARRAAPLPTPSSFRAAVEQAGRLFPGQTVAAEFAMAVVNTLDMGVSRPPRESLEIFDILEARARGELGRLDALAAAAMDDEQIAILARRLRAAGFQAAQPRPLAQPPSQTVFLAWIVDASKA